MNCPVTDPSRAGPQQGPPPLTLPPIERGRVWFRTKGSATVWSEGGGAAWAPEHRLWGGGCLPGSAGKGEGLSLARVALRRSRSGYNACSTGARPSATLNCGVVAGLLHKARPHPLDRGLAGGASAHDTPPPSWTEEGWAGLLHTTHPTIWDGGGVGGASAHDPPHHLGWRRGGRGFCT